MPFFSIIIPTYNRPDYLDIAINSVRDQTYNDYELIITDDASSDTKTRTLLENYVNSSSNIKAIFHQKNLGICEARNSALKIAKGKYIVLLDSDDYIFPWTLQTYFDTITKFNFPSFIAGPSAVMHEDCKQPKSYEVKKLQAERFKNYFEYRNSTKNWWFAPSGTAIKKESIDRAGRFWSGRDICEDIDLWHKLGIEPNFIKINSPNTYGYRVHNGGIHNNLKPYYSGLLRMIHQEKSGIYPGGKAYRKLRNSILYTHVRMHTIEMQENGLYKQAIKLYIKTLTANITLLRIKYLLGFLMLIPYNLIKGPKNRPPLTKL
ncbi:glycosyltransferase family 2 protein [Pelagicoccus sp. NFK12]|uniref:Glycosyltransferase family 2 protein n=1 Tax=Pelagicoccus enzymogenes TaxID=2773457 RepID=A0A927IGD4_9BACT|nr:glycosyltransferase family 2 protein [Pelagicoccus enzymogenes]MBD5781077.1 glycosyltransferase family 2 protein [Pelagicoccus enzymogenes]